MRDTATDVSISIPAITSPWWLQYLEFWVQHFAVFAGSILIALRLILAIREFWQDKKGK